MDGLVRSVHRATQAGGGGCGGRADGERDEDDNHEPAQSQVRVHSFKALHTGSRLQRLQRTRLRRAPSYNE